MTGYPKDFTFKRKTEEFNLTAFIRYNGDVISGVILTRDLKTDFCSMEVFEVQDKGDERGLRKVSNSSQLYVLLPDANYISDRRSWETKESIHPGVRIDGFTIGILTDDKFTLELLANRQAYFLNSAQKFSNDSNELKITQEEFKLAFEGGTSPLYEGFPQSLDMNTELQKLPIKLQEFINNSLKID